MVFRLILDRFDGLHVRAKILVGYVALIVPLVAITIMAGFMSMQGVALSRRISSESMPSLQALELVRDTGVRVVDAANTFALISAVGQSDDDSDRHIAELQAAREKFTDAVRSFETIGDVDGGGHSTFVQSILFARNDILQQSDRIAQIARSGAAPATVLQLRDRFEVSAAQFRTLIRAAIDAERTELAEQQRELLSWVSLSVVVGIGFAIVGIGIAVLGGLRVSERIARPIRRLRDVALQIGDGKLETPDLPQTRDEVGELVSAFRTMIERLRDSMVKLARQERLATLGQLAGTVSHELRNPLGVIRNSLFSLRESIGPQPPAATGRLIERMERNVVRCNAIVSDLLDYARSGHAKRSPVDVDQWLAKMLEEHVLPQGIALRHELNANEEVLLDQQRFWQVLVNLLDNAAQAMLDPAWQRTSPPESVITVRSALAGPFLRLEVADTGPGISAEILADIFEPLFTTKSFGVGLGLPMIRQIVQQHAGTIDVVSEPGQGATFVIRVPRTLQRQDQAA